MTDGEDKEPGNVSDSRALDMIWALLAGRQAGNMLLPNELNVLLHIMNMNGRKLA